MTQRRGWERCVPWGGLSGLPHYWMAIGGAGRLGRAVSFPIFIFARQVATMAD